MQYTNCIARQCYEILLINSSGKTNIDLLKYNNQTLGFTIFCWFKLGPHQPAFKLLNSVWMDSSLTSFQKCRYHSNEVSVLWRGQEGYKINVLLSPPLFFLLKAIPHAVCLTMQHLYSISTKFSVRRNAPGPSHPPSLAKWKKLTHL